MKENLEFDLDRLIQDAQNALLPTSEQEPSMPRKSHVLGRGTEFCRVLFRIGGQSPLVAYYLKMHNIAIIPIVPYSYKIQMTQVFRWPAESNLMSRKARKTVSIYQEESTTTTLLTTENIGSLKVSEVTLSEDIGSSTASEETELKPTYRDAVAESKKLLARNKAAYKVKFKTIREEIKSIKNKQLELNKNFLRLKNKARRRPEKAMSDCLKYLEKLRQEQRSENYELTRSPSSVAAAAVATIPALASLPSCRVIHYAEDEKLKLQHEKESVNP